MREDEQKDELSDFDGIVEQAVALKKYFILNGVTPFDALRTVNLFSSLVMEQAVHEIEVRTKEAGGK
jgi:hypothetical protein